MELQLAIRDRMERRSGSETLFVTAKSQLYQAEITDFGYSLKPSTGSPSAHFAPTNY